MGVIRHIALPPLEQPAAENLLKQRVPSLLAAEQKQIVEWTGGYPLGLITVARIVAEKSLSPADPDRAVQQII